MFTQQILAESLYIPIWIFLIACLLFLKEGSNLKLLLGAGVFLGLLALVRREAILPGGILTMAILWGHNRAEWKRTLLQIAVIFMAAGLVVLPWLVRNSIVLGKPVLSSSGGVNFMVGNNPLGTGGYTPPPPEWQAQFQGLGELERDQKAWQLSLQWVRERPGDFIRLLPKKLSELWGPAHNLALDLSDALLALLCLPGIIRLIQRKENWETIAIVALTPIFTTTLIGLIFVGGWRYRQLVYPGLILLAGYGITQLFSEHLSAAGHFRMQSDRSVS